MPLIQWIAENHVGDLASIAGIFISIVGFFVTLWNVWRSRSAAERAEMAANEARRIIRSYETVAEFSSAITLMEEIKRLHRSRQSEMLPDRDAALRKALISVRRLAPSLQGGQDTTLQAAITTLAAIEGTIEKSIHGGSEPDYVRLNRLLSRDIDALHAVLIDIKAAGERLR
jgi:hypothetical protein